MVNQNEGVIIDLSRSVADSLDFVIDGRVKVKVEVIKWGDNYRKCRQEPVDAIPPPPGSGPSGSSTSKKEVKQ